MFSTKPKQVVHFLAVSVVFIPDKVLQLVGRQRRSIRGRTSNTNGQQKTFPFLFPFFCLARPLSPLQKDKRVEPKDGRFECRARIAERLGDFALVDLDDLFLISCYINFKTPI